MDFSSNLSFWVNQDLRKEYEFKLYLIQVDSVIIPTIDDKPSGNFVTTLLWGYQWALTLDSRDVSFSASGMKKM